MAALRARDAFAFALPSSDDAALLARMREAEPRLPVMARARRGRLRPALIQVDVEDLSPALLARVHAAEARTFVNALGLIDVRATTEGAPLYAELFARGADVVQTDRPDLAGEAARRANALRYPW